MNIKDINFAIDILSHPQSGDESDINMALNMAIKSLKGWREIIEELNGVSHVDDVKSTKHGDIIDKIRLEMIKSARPIVSEYNKLEDGMSLRKILQIIDYWHNTESEVEK